MNPIRTVRRLACILAGLTAAALAFAAAAPAALAWVPLPPGGPAGPPRPLPPIHTTMGSVVSRLTGPVGVPRPLPGIHPVTAGGMPGWQIALIAAAAALFTAVVAVLLDRALAARRHGAASTA